MPNRLDSTSSSPRGLQLPMALIFAIATLFLRFGPLPENFAAFGALCMFCGLMLKPPMRWAVPLLTLFAADCIGHVLGKPGMGFYSLMSMVINYLAMASVVLIGSVLSRSANRRDNDRRKEWAIVGGGCLAGSVSFFLISNFGAWLDPITGYDRTLQGLVDCYAMGIPFYRSTLISDMVFGLGFFAVYQFVAANSLRAVRVR